MLKNLRLLTLVSFLFFFAKLATAGDNIMIIHDVVADPTDVILVEVEVVNDDPFRMFELKVPLPEGFTYVEGSFALDPDRENGHIPTVSVTSGNVLQIGAYTLTGANFHGNDGNIATFSLNTPNAPGQYTLDIVSGHLTPGIGGGYSNLLTGTEPGTVTLLGDDPIEFTLTMTTVGDGSVTVDGAEYTAPLSVEAGTKVTIAAFPDTDWQFNGWTGDHTGQISSAEISMNGNKTITANFIQTTETKYSLTLTFDNGLVNVNGSPYTGAVEVSEGTILELEAVPDPGYVFDGWTGDHTGATSPILVTMDDDKEIAANFSESPTGVNIMKINDVEGEPGSLLTIELEILNNDPFVAFSADIVIPEAFDFVAGSLTLNDDRITDHVLIHSLTDNTLKLSAYSPGLDFFLGNQGSILHFDLEAPDEYGVSPLVIDDAIIVGDDDSDILSNTVDGTITVKDMAFIINAVPNNEAYGTVSGAGEYEEGETVTLTATPATGYHFVNWTEDDEVVMVGAAAATATYTFVAEEDRDLIANFAINVYTITATAGEGGSITPAGAVEVDHGTDQVFVIEAGEVYMIDDVLVDGVSVGAVVSYTFENVTENHTIEAQFTLKTYIITATASEGGSITPAGDVEVEHGGSQVFTFAPDEGFFIADVLVDDVSVGVQNAFTFVNITKNHSIHVDFETFTYTLIYIAGENGSLQGDTEQVVEYGGDGTPVEAVPDTGYHFVAWSDGVADNPRTDTNITDDLEVTAEFALTTYVITATAGEGGSIDPAGEVEVLHGGNQSFSIIPDEGYHIENVRVDQTSIGAPDSYTFVNVTSSHSIHAVFARSVFDLSFHVVDAGGEEIPDAVITLNDETYEAGEYVFTGLWPDTYIYMVSRDGYFDQEGELTIIDDDVTVTVEMEVDDTSINDIEGISMQVYPNPAGHQLTVEANAPLGSVRVMDMLGQVVYEAGEEGHRHEINVSAMRSGVYFVQVYSVRGVKTMRVQVTR